MLLHDHFFVSRSLKLGSFAYISAPPNPLITSLNKNSWIVFLDQD